MSRSTHFGSPSRRTFVLGAAAAGLAAPWMNMRPVQGRSALEQVNLGHVGVGGKGWSDMLETSVGQNVVAICDVDEQRLAAAAEKFPNAARFTDWRRLMDHPGIDAVTISTPDHMHAPVTLAAIESGKHVYTQKPLTHDVAESRALTAAAAKAGIVSQMGIQHHSSARLKIAVQVIRDGVIGKVSEVHTWTDRPGSFWKQGLSRPATADNVPDYLHWDLWLGTAPARPFVANLYHPFHWRGWWDFGTGALGDMGCHIMDPVINALELGPPRTVEAEGPEPDAESGPLWCIVRYEFPGTAHTTDSVKLTWYEAGKQPDPAIIKAPADWAGSQNGVLFVGEKGNLFVGFPEMPELFPREDFADFSWPDLVDDNHYTQWTAAIRGEGATSCPFAYSGPLTETVLLGNVAYRSQAKIEWNADSMQCVGNDAAQALIQREYRAY
ncbi:MAG: Gfo/Idh/MocA family oxidoreductase [Pirellulaceae bacterium]